MYTVIRRYITQPGASGTIAQRVREGFLPIISEMPGFVSYYLVTAGDDSIVSVSTFEDREGADASTRAATDWARQNIGSLVRNAPIIITGETVLRHGAEVGKA